MLIINVIASILFISLIRSILKDINDLREVTWEIRDEIKQLTMPKPKVRLDDGLVDMHGIKIPQFSIDRNDF